MLKSILSYMFVAGCGFASCAKSGSWSMGGALLAAAAIAALIGAALYFAFTRIPVLAALRLRHHDHLVPATARSYRARRA